MIRIDEEQYEQLQYIAEKRGKSMTFCLKEILDKAFNGSTQVTIEHHPNGSQELYNKSSNRVAMNEVDEFGIPINLNEDIQQTDGVRTKSKVLFDIDKVKRAMAEELAYCQDPDARFTIETRHKKRIAELWEEFYMLEAANV